MPDKYLEKRIHRAYGWMKYGRIKMLLMYLVICVLMIGIVSLFLGNPFPHKETIFPLLFRKNVFGFSVWDSGWLYTGITEYLYLMVTGCVIALVLAFLWLCGVSGGKLAGLDRILLKQCDVKKYMDAMNYAVDYGRGLKLQGFQESVFLLMQQRMVCAWIAGGKLEESRRFLTGEWRGKKNSNVYKQTMRTLELSEAYVSRDAERFHMLLQRAGRRFRKQKLLTARGLFLEQKYEQAAVCLQSYKGENTYHEVLRQYLLGKCLHKMEDKKMAEKCMEYVSVHGNTMPCQKKAQEWLLSKQENDG